MPYLERTTAMRVTTALLSIALLAAPQLPRTAMAQTPPTSAAGLSETDRQFLVKDAQGGAYERAIAELAQKNAQRGDVKAYAARLAADHARYNQALQELGRAKGLPLPTDMSAEDSTKLAAMGSLPASGFDDAFVAEAIRINDEDKSAAGTESSRTTDADIKAFLAKFKSVDEEHEQLALALKR